MEGAPDRGSSTALTCLARNRSWLLAYWPSSKEEGHCGARQGASEALRQPCSWSTTPRQGGTALMGGARSTSPSCASGDRERGRRSWVRAVKRVSTWGRVAVRRAGAATFTRARASTRAGSEEAVTAIRRGLGSRTVRECSYRESVAEVDEKHLSHAAKGSREANRGGAG